MCAHRRRHLVGRVHNSGPPIPAEDLPISSNTSTAGGPLASPVNRAPGWGSPKTSSSATQGWIEVESNASAGTTLRLAAGFAAVTFRPGGRTWGPGPLALHAGRVHPLVSGFSSSLGGRPPPAFTDREPTSVGVTCHALSRGRCWPLSLIAAFSTRFPPLSPPLKPAPQLATRIPAA
jgi:hypothetical protein